MTCLLISVPLLHLLVSPYTKVEESFNIQAVHDILVYGTPHTDVSDRLFAAYDHLTFSGAVPRTFLGAVILAGLGQPIIALVGFQHAQLVVRGLLGAANVAALLTFKNLLKKSHGQGVAAWWVVLMASQFHINYYLSRTLPNMYAFGLSKSINSPTDSQGLQLTRISNSCLRISITSGLGCTSLCSPQTSDRSSSYCSSSLPVRSCRSPGHHWALPPFHKRLHSDPLGC